MSSTETIAVAGGDTTKSLSFAKRLAIITKWLEPGLGPCLDCGCGRGKYVEQLRREYGWEAFGVEYLAAKVEAAKANKFLSPFIEQGDLEQLHHPDNSFGSAILNEVLEHVPDDPQAMSEVFRILRPRGRLIIFSPNRWFPFESHGAQMRRGGGVVPPWVPFVPWFPEKLIDLVIRRWARNYWQAELASLATAAGFKIVHRDYIWQTFENISNHQPWLIRRLTPLFRTAAKVGESLPLVRRFGISQVLVCEKP